MNANKCEFNFDSLVGAIGQIHSELAVQASHAVNISLTLRNWLIGMYIHEFEQNGADRALYGTGLIDTLAGAIGKVGGYLLLRTIHPVMQAVLSNLSGDLEITDFQINRHFWR